MAKIINEYRCEQWLKRALRHYIDGTHTKGIEVNAFWKLATDAGVYIPDTYGDDAPMSKVLPKYVKEIVSITNPETGEHLFSSFRFA